MPAAVFFWHTRPRANGIRHHHEKGHGEKKKYSRCGRGGRRGGSLIPLSGGDLSRGLHGGGLCRRGEVPCLAQGPQGLGGLATSEHHGGCGGCLAVVACVVVVVLVVVVLSRGYRRKR